MARRSSSHAHHRTLTFCALICASTMALQVLTTSPSALTGRLEQLWRKFVTEEKQQVELPASELVVGNLSVHRVRYVEQNADADTSETEDESSEAASSSPTSLFASEFDRLAAVVSGRSRRTEVSSVVVTWEDVDARWNEPVDAASSAKAEETKDSDRECRVVYELQHWVAGWGLDAFWHASNRKFTTPDPFVVLADLPTEHDVSFRVRVRVKQTRGFLSGMMFATETDGPWSETVTLSASRDDALQAIVVFLSSNRMFFLVLAICIGLGTLVVLRLLVAQRFVQSSGTHAPIATSPLSPKKKVRLSHGSSSGADPEQEIADLRQELADSEAEVRKLMIYRGYGLEQLTTNELSHVARELSETLKRVQRLQQPPFKATGKKSLFESSPVEDPFDEDHF